MIEAEGRQVVERLGGEWRRGGGMCRCPAHDDHSPSLSVRPGTRRLLFHCFAGCQTVKVIAALNALRLLGPGGRICRDAGRLPADSNRHNASAAARLWAEARSIQRSPAEAYLRNRGLAAPAADLRYHPRTPYGRGKMAIFRPAMLAAVRDRAGLVGVHRTFLDSSTDGLADLPLPKRALGRLGRGAVRLGPPADGSLGLAEGIENAIAAASLFGIPCWATLGTERFGRVEIPARVTRLVLFLDHDAGGARAEKLAREKHGRTNLEIEARYPCNAGSDWNDVLLRRHRA
jgi:putative DNA primase/helicase